MRLDCANVGFCAARGPLQLQSHLSVQCVERAAERMAYVVVLAFLAQVGWAQPHREERSSEIVDDALQGGARWELAPAEIAVALMLAAPAVARLAQPGDNAGQVEQRGFQGAGRGFVRARVHRRCLFVQVPLRAQS